MPCRTRCLSHLGSWLNADSLDWAQMDRIRIPGMGHGNLHFKPEIPLFFPTPALVGILKSGNSVAHLAHVFPLWGLSPAQPHWEDGWACRCGSRWSSGPGITSVPKLILGGGSCQPYPPWSAIPAPKNDPSSYLTSPTSNPQGQGPPTLTQL